MKLTFFFITTLLASLAFSLAGPDVDNDDFAKSLGGWKKKDTYIDYTLSGAAYRTYKPEISPTPDGGIFVSIRIDHLRGWLSSDDHATLELTFNPKGVISTAQSTIAIQGQSIASDVIVGTNEAGKEIINPNRTVQIGTDLISNLTAKLLLENIVEAGRVSFPAAIRHNYNHLFQAMRVEGVAIPTAVVIPNEPIVLPPTPPVVPAPVTPPAPVPGTAPATASTTPPVAPPPTPIVPAPTTPAPVTPEPAPPGSAPLEIKQY
jgi:hypothetical protein